MITKEQQKTAQKRAAEMIRQAGIKITEKEANSPSYIGNRLFLYTW